MNKKSFIEAWKKPMSKHEWDNFLRHNFYSPDRLKVYEIINSFAKGNFKEKPFDFLEIGFGQCHDFENCFKALHDSGRIIYCGIDITEQFINHAKSKYPNYWFLCEGYEDIKGLSFDITYTGKTLEHQPPEDYQKCLENMLDATDELCVINWFISPKKKERMFWNKNQLAWTNVYSEKKIAQIIDDCGFKYDDIEITSERHIYIITKRNG